MSVSSSDELRTLGQPDPYTNQNIIGSFNQPLSVTSANGHYFVADRGNNRVLIYNNFPSGFTAAAVVVGQFKNTSGVNWGGLSARSLYAPSMAVSDGTHLIVADTDNNRVLIWNQIPSSDFQPADIVLGQNSMTTNDEDHGGVSASSLAFPSALAIDHGKLYVSDYVNSRVLVWDSIPTVNGQAADLVLGQPDFSASSRNTGGLGPATLAEPGQIAITGNRLFVADGANNRVLIWNSIPSQSGAAADVVLGQTNFTSAGSGTGLDKMNYPWGLATDGTRLFVSDTSNNRVLVWNALSFTSGQAADFVLGQPDENSSLADNGGTSAATMNDPEMLFIDGTSLLVSDYLNSRILGWNPLPGAAAPATLLAGQISFDSDLPNDAGVLGANSKNGPTGVDTDGRDLFVADTYNNRVLIWNHIPEQNREPANIVLGQATMTDNLTNAGGLSARSLDRPQGVAVAGSSLFVVDSFNHRVLGWKSIPTANDTPADFVLGQADMASNTPNTGGVSARTFDYPWAASSDGHRLAVADYYNSRVLIWNTIPTTTDQPADIVLGQTSTSVSGDNNGGISAATMKRPTGVFIADDTLVVADMYNHRVLIWKTFPTASGAAADVVLGQPDGASNTANNGGVSARSLNYPTKVFLHDGKLCVSDGGNFRVLIWNTIPSSDFAPASEVFGQKDFVTNVAGGTDPDDLTGTTLNGPGDIRFADGHFFLADHGNNRVLIIPTGLFGN